MIRKATGIVHALCLPTITYKILASRRRIKQKNQDTRDVQDGRDVQNSLPTRA